MENPYLEKTLELIKRQIGHNTRQADAETVTSPHSSDMGGDIVRVRQFMAERNLYARFTRNNAAPAGESYVSEALEVVKAIGQSRYPRFTIDRHNLMAYVNFIKWCHGDPSMQHVDPQTGNVTTADLNRGIYIAGGTGRGKSVCLEIMRIYCAFKGFTINCPGSCGEMTSRPLVWQNVLACSITSAFADGGGYSQYAKKELLGIQDFGSEPEAVSHMGNRFDIMKMIMEDRGDDPNKITLVTSNLSIGGKALAERYGERVVSRMNQMFNYLPMTGPDRRLKS